VNRSGEIPNVVDVEGVDAYQGRPSFHEPGRGVEGEKWVVREISRCSPVGIPPGTDQHRLPSDIDSVKSLGSDTTGLSPLIYHDSVQISERLQGECGDVPAKRVAVEGGIDIRAGIGHHLDLPDVKFHSGGISLSRGRSTQEIADDGTGKAGIGDHPVRDAVAQVQKGHGASVIR